jgi:hypothetical protein
METKKKEIAWIIKLGISVTNSVLIPYFLIILC